MQNTLKDQVSIRPNCISLYSVPVNRQIRSEAQIKAEKHLKVNTHKGVISAKADKRIKNAVDWLLYFSQSKTFYNRKYKQNYKFRICFVTLTLSAPQLHTDNQIKSELLNQFFVEFRKKWKVKHYLWRAEPQKNGNIHFHLICDKFIPWHELRSVWNRCQSKLGYIDRFKAKHKHRNPNSTDIHSVKNVKNLSRYLAKYMTKNKQEREIQGRQWGLSQSLSKVKSAKHERDRQINMELDFIRQAFKKQVVVNEYVTCIYVSVAEWSRVVKGYLYKLFMSYLRYHNNPCRNILENLDISIIGIPPPKPIPILQPIQTKITQNWTQKSFNF